MEVSGEFHTPIGVPSGKMFPEVSGEFHAPTGVPSGKMFPVHLDRRFADLNTAEERKFLPHRYTDGVNSPPPVKRERSKLL
jgi:hypothetical protein